MKIVVGEWFWMPQVGGDVFKKLVKDAGLKYDKSNGFQATPETDMRLVAALLQSALKEDVEVMLKCFICGAPVECEECRYNDVCGSTKTFQSCICKDCETKEVSALYSMRFTELVG